MSRFKPKYRDLTPDEEATVAAIKQTAADMEELFEDVPHSREKSLAITKLEEAVMWATKAVTA